jgi:glutamine amidotransferase
MEAPRFYFVHSYHLECEDPETVAATAEHGYVFPAAVARGKVHGVQFHPEKSHKFGMQLFANFGRL